MSLPQELPEVNELVVCKITKVLDYGVFVELLEYDNAVGFVHVSQVASSWIKNIRNFVKENQIRVAKVISINKEKGQIDLSFNKVSASEQHQKMQDYSRLKKPQKLVEIVAKKCHTEFDSAWKEISKALLEHYDSIYDAFEMAKLQGEEALKGVPKKYIKPLLDVIETNIEIPKKMVSGTMIMYCPLPNGVEIIKEALKSAESAASKIKEAKTDIFYSGSGKYDIKIVSHDYKIAEAALKSAVDAATKVIEGSNGVIKFERGNGK